MTLMTRLAEASFAASSSNASMARRASWLQRYHLRLPQAVNEVMQHLLQHLDISNRQIRPAIAVKAGTRSWEGAAR